GGADSASDAVAGSASDAVAGSASGAVAGSASDAVAGSASDAVAGGAADRERVGRVRFMDAQRVNLDGFAGEDAELGLVAMRSPHAPEPGLVIRDGRVTEMDGVTDDRFDSLDAYIARHGIDLAVAEEAMSLPDVEFARRLVSPDVPRSEIIRLSAGATPANLARALAPL